MVAPDPRPAVRLNDDQAAELDHLILTNRKLQAIAFLRELTNVGIHDALGVFSARFEELKANAPQSFEVDLDRYWEGFYS